VLLETTRSLKGSVHYAILYLGTSTKLTNGEETKFAISDQSCMYCTVQSTGLAPQELLI
jgi:hypothetical protein